MSGPQPPGPEYLRPTSVIDADDPAVRERAHRITAGLVTDVDRARALYEWVRDAIPHSWDIRTRTVTCTASQVLRAGTGICMAKSHLLAALCRAVGVPAGLCYSVLRRGAPYRTFVLHGFNALYLTSLGRWVRVDPRGNVGGVDAQFDLDRERLAWPPDSAKGEFTYDVILADAEPAVTEFLTSRDDLHTAWAHLPEYLPSQPWRPEDHVGRTIRTYEGHAEQFLERTGDRRRLRARLDAFAARLPAPGPVLDLGCGPGADADELRRRGCRVLGVDLTLQMVRLARRAHPGPYARADMRALPFGRDARFAGIWASACLLHLDRCDVPGVLAALAAHLAPRGIVELSVKEGDGEAWDSRYGVDNPRWFTYWRAEALDAALDAAGFTTLEAERSERPPVTWLRRCATVTA